MLQKIKDTYVNAWLGDIREDDSATQEWVDRVLIFLAPILVTAQIFVYSLAPFGLLGAILIAAAILVVFVATTVSIISGQTDNKEKDKEN